MDDETVAKCPHLWTFASNSTLPHEWKIQKLLLYYYITQPFFELDNRDFAWKFVWTIQKNEHPCKEKSAWKSMQENSMDHGISYNSTIF